MRVDPELGRRGERLAWTQDQTYVEVYFRLPRNVPASGVQVEIQRERLSVSVTGTAVLAGRLCRPVKVEESLWLIQDGVLEVTLLKESRRGNYADGDTAFHTFWRTVVVGAPADERIPGDAVPPRYYKSASDVSDMPAHQRVASSSRPMIDRSRERR